jgi:Nuclease A inhibitor-like protein
LDKKFAKNVKKNQKNFESQSSGKKSKNSSENSLIGELTNAVKGLYYISETDAEIFPFSGQKVSEISRLEILRQTENSEGCEVEERDFNEIFDRLTTIQDWFGKNEIDRAEKFLKLRKILENHLRDLKVFKLGRIKKEIYFVGVDSENFLKGIKTIAVET